MKRFKRYERYKDSGVEWIGEIPEHWNLSRFKNYIKLINEKVESNELDLHYVGLENIESFTGKLIEGASYIGEGVSIIFTPKDVLFGKLRPYLAKVLLPSFNGRCSTELLVLRPIDNSLVDRSYLYYYCLSDGFINIVNSSTYGARMPRTSWDFISLLTLTLPSLHEQKAIAIFLNQKTAEIDSLIADKERLIELLQEQRQAIITQAVTKGLDPNVPMKDSGVEWIGEIPEHWLTVAVKRVYDIKLGKMLQPTQNKSDDVLVPYLKALHVQWEKIEVNEYPEMWASPKDIEMFSVKPGDLLICEGGEVGRAAILEDLDRPCIIQNSLHRIRPSVKAKNKYLLYILQIISQKGWLDVLCNKATIAHFTSDKLGNLRIPLPPIEEQEKVIKVIENKAKLLNNYISCEREIIEKLKNYRQSLITAAVTGKIDVRDYYNLRSE